MSLTINTNIPSIQANNQLSSKLKELQKNFESLASGKRINRAADDPAGLAIALDLLANADTGAVAARNISDGVSALSIAEGSLSSAADITVRMSELATQAANGTLSDTQRGALDKEYQALSAELNRISATTEFNGQQLLSGSTSISIQAGTGGGAESQIGVSLPGVSSSSLNLTANLLSQDSARQAIEQSKSAVSSLASSRAEIGAGESRLQAAFQNLKTAEVNQRGAASSILDADIALESANLARNKIAVQGAAAISVQANIIPQLAQKLLG